MQIIVEQIPAYAVVTEYLLGIFQREPLGTLHLAGQLKLRLFYLAGKAEHKVVVLGIIVAADIFQLRNVQSDLLLDLAHCGILGIFATLDISRNVDVIFGNIPLLDEGYLGVILGYAKAYYTGVGKWEKRAAAVIAIGYLALIAAIFRVQLCAALRTVIKSHICHPFLTLFIIH